MLSYKHYYIEDALDKRILGIVNLNTIDEIFEDFEVCRVFSRVFVCFSEFPPCDTNSSKLLPLCPERCWELDTLIETCGQLVNLIVRNYYNCSIPQSYYVKARDAVSNTSCSKWDGHMSVHMHMYVITEQGISNLHSHVVHISLSTIVLNSRD